MRYLVLIITMSATGCGGSICDPEELASALSSASAGDRIELGACSISGNFEVPPGIDLRGEGSTRTQIVPASGAPALRLNTSASAGATAVTGLRIDSNTSAGIAAGGGGAVVLHDIEIRSFVGIGIGLEGLASAQLGGIELIGPVTADNAGMFPLSVTSMQVATDGLVASSVAMLALTDVDVRGFAQRGVLLVNSQTTWERGASTANLGVGLMVEGGTANVSNVEVCQTLQGVRLLPAFGAVFTSTPAIDTEALRVCDSEGFGVLHTSGTGRHIGFSGIGNANAALWAQRTTMFEASGTLTQNGFAGVIVANASNIILRDLEIEQTTSVTHLFDTFGSVQVGDGVQLREVQSAQLNQMRLRNNELAGIVIELAGQPLNNVTFQDVEVTVTSAAQGAVVAQNGTTLNGWDNGVVRIGTSAINDETLRGRFETVEAVGPCDYAAVSGVQTGGLAAIVQL